MRYFRHLMMHLFQINAYLILAFMELVLRLTMAISAIAMLTLQEIIARPVFMVRHYITATKDNLVTNYN